MFRVRFEDVPLTHLPPLLDPCVVGKDRSRQVEDTDLSFPMD